MARSWESERHRAASQGSDDGKKLLYLIISRDSEDATECDDDCSTDVLAELSLFRLGPSWCQITFDDIVGREDLEGIREEEHDRKEDLDSIRDDALPRETLGDEWMVDSFSAIAEDHVFREDDIEEPDTSDNKSEDFEVVFFLLCDLLDGQDDSDSLKGVHREANS